MHAMKLAGTPDTTPTRKPFIHEGSERAVNAARGAPQIAARPSSGGAESTYRTRPKKWLPE